MKIKRDNPISRAVFWTAFGIWLDRNEDIPTEADIWALMWRVPLACVSLIILAVLWLGVYGYILAVTYAGFLLFSPEIIGIAILQDFFFVFLLFILRRSFLENGVKIED